MHHTYQMYHILWGNSIGRGEANYIGLPNVERFFPSLDKNACDAVAANEYRYVHAVAWVSTLALLCNNETGTLLLYSL